MTIRLTEDAVQAIFPRAPAAIVRAFVEKQSELDKRGITHTRQRLKYFFANIEHECGGFTIPNLTENINYSAERMAQVWPNRFHSAGDVKSRYGTAPGWQRKAFDDIYGNRMGNRPGTHDGSDYIGRGAPQITGRDGYREVGKRIGVNLELAPTRASEFALQPAICAAFWQWKNLNVTADTSNFTKCVRLWNGGTNGMADRQRLMAGNNPIIDRLAVVDAIDRNIEQLPGKPPTPEPPKEVNDEATKTERRTRTGGGAAAGAGGATEGAKQTGTVQPDKALPTWATVTCITVGVVVVVVATVLIANKLKLVKANWR